MNAEQLKALQAPIKERYKKDPGAALITLRAEGRLGEGLACHVETGKGLVEAGLIRLHFTLVTDTGPEPVEIRNAVQVRVS